MRYESFSHFTIYQNRQCVCVNSSHEHTVFLSLLYKVNFNIDADDDTMHSRIHFTVRLYIFTDVVGMLQNIFLVYIFFSFFFLLCFILRILPNRLRTIVFSAPFDITYHYVERSFTNAVSIYHKHMYGVWHEKRMPLMNKKSSSPGQIEMSIHPNFHVNNEARQR